jgi:elongation factor P--(R)-beta-lysine ligase
VNQNRATAPWKSHVYADRRPFLLQRAALMKGFRSWFDSQDFLEVETPILQISPGNETHLHAFATEWITPVESRIPLYLHTSPEFACKKLLAAGETRIVTMARVFRNREKSSRHHPEFTMIEWYRTGDPYEQLMADCEALLWLAADITGRAQWQFAERQCNALAKAERVTLEEAFLRYVGFRLLDTVLDDGEVDRDMLAKRAASLGMRITADDTWSDVFSKVLSAHIEPHLGTGRPTILCEYPITEAALARPKPSDPRVAERFELYVCGVELANAFAELTDAKEQRRRFAADMDQKQALYGERYPIDEDFLEALAEMPAASGIALGFDRLAMLASGAQRIDDVLWLPVMA